MATEPTPEPVEVMADALARHLNDLGTDQPRACCAAVAEGALNHYGFRVVRSDADLAARLREDADALELADPYEVPYDVWGRLRAAAALYDPEGGPT